jgi:DNA invertase Pin-like site-specific DNA recombinase
MRRQPIPVTARGYVIGEHHHRAKLTANDVQLILSLLNEGVPQREIAVKFEISRRAVRDIQSGKTWSSRAERQLDIDLIRRLHSAGSGVKTLARRFHCSPRTVRALLLGKTGSVERERQLASRWPSRIRPARPDEFDECLGA